MPDLSRVTIMLVLVLACPSAVLSADRPRTGHRFENDRLQLALVPRGSDQIAAFYEARGFPPAALEQLRQACFITVHIENKGEQVLWLELDQWEFSAAGQRLERLDSGYWQAQWQSIGLPQAKRSTFGWTQLPARRDLHHDESVGGNVVLPGDAGKIDIKAVFNSGTDKQGEMVRLGFGPITCPAEAP